MQMVYEDRGVRVFRRFSSAAHPCIRSQPNGLPRQTRAGDGGLSVVAQRWTPERHGCVVGGRDVWVFRSPQLRTTNNVGCRIGCYFRRESGVNAVAPCTCACRQQMRRPKAAAARLGPGGPSRVVHGCAVEGPQPRAVCRIDSPDRQNPGRIFRIRPPAARMQDTPSQVYGWSKFLQ